MVNRMNRNRIPYGGCERDSSPVCNIRNGAPIERKSCNSNEKALLKKLQTVDFSIVDTVLYLDAYPTCQKALAHYHKLLEERAMILKALGELGKPINNMSNTAKSWNWTDSPWPWEYEANV